MSRKYESSFVSEADGMNISVMAVLPDEKPYRAMVQIVHGMSEHKERYLPFMEYLAEKGYVTVIHDHRGHGKSVRSKGDLGYMYGGGAEAMLKDIGTVNRDIRERFPELSLILMGHSMGSLAVRAFAGKHDDCMDMLIVCGSPSKNAARPLGKQSHMWRNVSSAPVIRAKYWRRFPSEAMLHVSGTKKTRMHGFAQMQKRIRRTGNRICADLPLRMMLIWRCLA